MKIEGWRRLVFGLYTVTLVAVVEIIKASGWSKVGMVALGLTVVCFYGERMVNSVRKLVEAVKGKFFSKGEDNDGKEG